MVENFIDIAKKAKQASLEIADLSSEIKNSALNKIADMIEQNKDEIFASNKQDLISAEELISSGEISKSVYNRLKLDENKMRDMIQGIRDIANLEDPVGKILLKRKLDEDLILQKVSCPIGYFKRRQRVAEYQQKDS